MSVFVWASVAAVAATPLTLEEVKSGARQSLDSIRAQLDAEKAQSQVTTARSVILPQLDFNFGAAQTFGGPQRIFSTVPRVQPDGSLTFEQRTVDTPAFTQGRFNLGLSWNQLLYDGGRWWNRLAQAGAQEEAAQGQLAEQQLASELEATRRFFELVKSQLTLQVLDESLHRSEELLLRAQALYEAGRGQRSAVYDAQTNIGNDEINLVRQRQRVHQARLALLQWIGRGDADCEAVVPADLGAVQGLSSVATALERAKKARPLFKSLQAQADAGELGVSVARADFLPRLSASAAYARTSPVADTFFADFSKQNAFTLGATLTWDLFSGFEHSAQLERARSDHRLALAQQRQALLDLEAEIRRAHEALTTEQDVLRIAERNLIAAQEQWRLEGERFAAGAGSSLEVRNAQLKLTQAQLTVLQGRSDVATARAVLERAMGEAL